MEGAVYNVTPFLKDHPGGSSIVLPHLGTDMSEVFKDEDYHVHRCAKTTTHVSKATNHPFHSLQYSHLHIVC